MPNMATTMENITTRQINFGGQIVFHLCMTTFCAYVVTVSRNMVPHVEIQ